MTWGNFLYNLSNINAVAGSVAGYASDKNYGATNGEALMNFGLNVAYGGIRNAAAKDIYDRSGSILGFAANSAAGYGTPESNYAGVMGLMGASLLTSPGGIFSPYYGGCHHQMPLLSFSTHHHHAEVFSFGPRPTGYGLGPGGCYSRERFTLPSHCRGWHC